MFDLEEYDGEDDPRQIIVRIDHSIRPSVRFEKPEDIEQVAWYYETMHHAFRVFRHRGSVSKVDFNKLEYSASGVSRTNNGDR